VADAKPSLTSQALAPDQPEPGVGTFSPFRYPVFRAIWIANLFSNLGGMIQSIAAAWMMTELTTSHQLVALVQSSASVPIMLFGVFAGESCWPRKSACCWSPACWRD
jgi:hypothetical protein